MFSIDPRIRGLPATREQVVSLLQSINTPHLAIPGKQPGPAQAFILGVRTTTGFAVFVYLHLGESGDCAVYGPERRNLTWEEYAAEEEGAVGFVESMGFMMDNLNFREQPPEQQDELLATLAVFQREPKKLGPTAAEEEAKTANPALARLLSAF